jgi:hypothetical protein
MLKDELNQEQQNFVNEQELPEEVCLAMYALFELGHPHPGSWQGLLLEDFKNGAVEAVDLVKSVLPMAFVMQDGIEEKIAEVINSGRLVIENYEYFNSAPEVDHERGDVANRAIAAYLTSNPSGFDNPIASADLYMAPAYMARMRFLLQYGNMIASDQRVSLENVLRVVEVLGKSIDERFLEFSMGGKAASLQAEYEASVNLVVDGITDGVNVAMQQTLTNALLRSANVGRKLVLS